MTEYQGTGKRRRIEIAGQTKIFLCMGCCWYDDEDGKCLKEPIFNDPDTGKVGWVDECSGYVEIEHWNRRTKWNLKHTNQH